MQKFSTKIEPKTVTNNDAHDEKQSLLFNDKNQRKNIARRML